MSVKSGQAVTVLFSTANASTGAAADATGTPSGTLYVNGTANGASVTVTNITTGLYKAAVTLPSLTAGDVVSIRIAATVSSVAGEGVVWQEVADTKRVSDLNDLAAGAQMDLVDAPNATATVNANLIEWLGNPPLDLDAGSPQVVTTNAVSVSGIVLANVVRENYQWLWQAIVSSVSGNVITTTGLKAADGVTYLADDKLIALIGWQVMFYKSVSGFPTVDAFWRTSIVSYTESVLTVADMPADDLSFGGFTVYLLPPGFGASGSGGGGLTAQETADAVYNLTPTGSPATDSAGDLLERILVDTGTTLPGLFAASGATITVISAVSGGTITVYVGDTWRFTLLSDELTLDDYDTLGLVVKRSETQPDDAALLYLRTDTGLERIGGAVPVDAANGELTKTANSFSALVHLDETQELIPGSYLWWLKAFDKAADPSEAKTLVTGGFALKRAGLQAVE